MKKGYSEMVKLLIEGKASKDGIGVKLLEVIDLKIEISSHY